MYAAYCILNIVSCVLFSRSVPHTLCFLKLSIKPLSFFYCFPAELVVVSFRMLTFVGKHVLSDGKESLNRIGSSKWETPDRNIK